MTKEADAIPIIGHHKGVPLHDCQDQGRLALVRRDIDKVFEETDIGNLVDMARDIRRAPEARLFARAKAEAALTGARDAHGPRPAGMTITAVRASAVGLDSQKYRHRRWFCSALDPVGPPRLGYPQPVARSVPLERDAS